MLAEKEQPNYNISRKKVLDIFKDLPNYQEKGNRPVVPVKLSSIHGLEDELNVHLMCVYMCKVDVGEHTASLWILLGILCENCVWFVLRFILAHLSHLVYKIICIFMIRYLN